MLSFTPPLSKTFVVISSLPWTNSPITTSRRLHPGGRTNSKLDQFPVSLPSKATLHYDNLKIFKSFSRSTYHTPYSNHTTPHANLRQFPAATFQRPAVVPLASYSMSQTSSPTHHNLVFFSISPHLLFRSLAKRRRTRFCAL